MAASGRCKGCGKDFYLKDGKVPWHEKDRNTCPGAGKKPK